LRDDEQLFASFKNNPGGGSGSQTNSAISTKLQDDEIASIKLELMQANQMMNKQHASTMPAQRSAIINTDHQMFERTTKAVE
jgi:hypothetical protein